MGFRV